MEEIMLVKKRNKNKKKIIGMTLSLALVFMVIGVSYAFFGYYKSGLYTYAINGGKMSVLYDEITGNNVTINNAYPLKDDEAEEEAIEFDFSITGYNESKKNVYYKIEMVYGSEIEGKNRFKDSDMKLTLIENEKTVLRNEIFDNLDKQGIYFGYIKSGTSVDTPTINNYKLRMWVNDNVYISNSIEDDTTLWDDDDFNWAYKNLSYSQIREFEEGNATKLSEVGISVYKTADYGKLYGSFKINVHANLDGDDIGILVYDNNGGVGGPTDSLLAMNMVTMQKPTMEGKGFLGWSTKKDATVPEYYAGDYYAGPAKTLYAVYGGNKNVMGVFPDDLLNYAYDIVDVNFVGGMQTNIDNNYNDAELKWDLTLDNQGSVKAWLEETTLYIASSGTTYLTDCANMFREWENLRYINFSNADTSMVTNMSYMFEDASSLRYLDVSGFNTSNVTDMSWMFANKRYLEELDLSNFDTSNVINMAGMFYYCGMLHSLDVSSFNTEKVENMSHMFEMEYRGYASLTKLDLSSFDTSMVTDMSYMFVNSYSLTSIDLSSFNTSKVTTMSYMFAVCGSLRKLDLSNFNTSNVIDMSWMFRSCDLSDFKISNLDTSKVTDMSYMFMSADYKYGTFDLDFLDTTSVTNIDYMFEYFSADSLFFSNKNLENVTSSSGIFYGFFTTSLYMENCEFSGEYFTNFSDDIGNTEFKYVSFKNSKNINISFRECEGLIEVDLSNCKFGNRDTISNMFYYCDSLEKVILDNCNFNTVTKISTLSYGCPNLKEINLKNAMTTNVTDMSNAFAYLTSLEYINLEGIDTSNVENMSYMFNGCSSLEYLDLSMFDTSSVTNMSYMFNGCSSLEYLDLSMFDTSKVTNMSWMFSNCSKLESVGASSGYDLNIETWITTNVTNMSYMFQNCNLLISIDLSNLDTSQVTDMSHMFSGCSKIQTVGVGSSYSLNIANWDTTKLKKTYGMFQNCTSLISVDLSSWDPDDLDAISTDYNSGMFENCSNLRMLDIRFNYDFPVSNYEYAFYGMPDDAKILIYSSTAITKILGISTEYRPAWTTANFSYGQN